MPIELCERGFTMRKFIVKMMNLGYLVAATLAIVFICVKPVFKASVNVNMDANQVGEVLEPILKKGGSSGSTESKSRAGLLNTGEISDEINKARITEAFTDPDDPSKSGLHASVSVSLASKYAFDFKNEHIINDVITTHGLRQHVRHGWLRTR